MWRVVYIAHNQQSAEQIKSFLSREGFLVNLRPAGFSDGTSRCFYEVLVPQSEAEEASEVISQTFTRAGLARRGPSEG